ncbi:MAG: DUF3575 domain-containing protein [Bacteroidota bacterium]
MRRHFDKVSILAFLLLSINTPSFAQNESVADASLYRPKLALKYNPFALFAYTPGFEIGAEHALSKHSSINYAANIVNDFGFRQNQDFRGYKFLAEYRHYNILNPSQPNNWYSGIQISYKSITTEGRDYLDRAGGNYQQLFDIKAQTTSLDFLLTHGLSEMLSNWCFVEVALTYGGKRLDLAYTNLPADAVYEPIDEGFLDFQWREEGARWFPVLRLHVKFNFILKK